MRVITCGNCQTKNRVDETKLASSEAKCGRCGTALPLSGGASAGVDDRPLVVTEATFQNEVLGASETRAVLLDCWAPWCGPCRMIAPVMDQLAAESNGRYRVAKLNVDENPRISSQFQISSIPTMLIFKNGKLVDRLIGAQPKPSILERLNQALR